MRNTRLAFAASSVALVISLVGLWSLIFGALGPVRPVLVIVAPALVVGLLAMSAAALLAFRPARLIVVSILGVLTGVLSGLSATALSLSADVSDGFIPPNILSTLTWPLAAVAVATAAGLGCILLSGAMKRTALVIVLGLFAAPALVGIIAIGLALWAVSLGLVLTSVALTPRAPAPAPAPAPSPVASIALARHLAVASLVLFVAGWAAALIVSIAATGTNAATTALASGVAAAQLAAVPLLVSLTLLFARPVPRYVWATVVLASAAVAAASVVRIISPSSDGGRFVVELLVVGAVVGSWLAALTFATLRLPAGMRAVIAVLCVLVAGQVWIGAVATSAGLVIAVAAVAVVLQTRQPRAISSLVVSSSVSK
jgi:hypothetical protein